MSWKTLFDYIIGLQTSDHTKKISKAFYYQIPWPLKYTYKGQKHHPHKRYDQKCVFWEMVAYCRFLYFWGPSSSDVGMSSVHLSFYELSEILLWYLYTILNGKNCDHNQTIIAKVRNTIIFSSYIWKSYSSYTRAWRHY